MTEQNSDGTEKNILELVVEALCMIQKPKNLESQPARLCVE